MSQEKTTRKVPTKDGTFISKNEVRIMYFEKKINMPSEFAQIEKMPKIGGTIFTNRRPFSFTEEDLIMPTVINKEPGEQGYRDAITEYFNSISVKVDEVDGLNLNISFRYETEELQKLGDASPESEKLFLGFPEKPSDYVLYRYLLVYSRCCSSILEVHKSAKIRFYIDDPQIAIAEKNMKSKARQDAYSEFISKKADVELMKNILKSIGNDINEETLIADVEDFAVTEPVRFLQLIRDERLPIRALIEEGLVTRTLIRLDNTDIILFGDVQLGLSTEEAIAKLLEDSSLKSRIQANIQGSATYRYNAPKVLSSYNARDKAAIEESIGTDLKEASKKVEEAQELLKSTEAATTEMIRKAQEEAEAIKKAAIEEAQRAIQSATKTSSASNKPQK